MVDVDRRTNPGHLAGLRRLSARAASTTSLSSLAAKVKAHLESSGVHVAAGLTEEEFAVAEAELGNAFPPDLRAVLSAGLPEAPGFPEWRGLRRSRLQLEVPVAAISFQIGGNRVWPKSWGMRPSDPEKAMRVALKRAPAMIPIFSHCYIPCNPPLAGNPVFFVDRARVFCCGRDLSHFFSHHASRSTPRWVEFWSDAAGDLCRFSPVPRVPQWVDDYVENKIGSVLRRGGWSESDVSEIVGVSASAFFDGEIDNLHALLLKADRFSDSLRKAGWSSDDVSDVFGFDFRTSRRPTVRIADHSSYI